MYKQVKVKGFTPYQEVTHGDGTTAIGKDGNPLKKRTVVIDCSFVSQVTNELMEETLVCDSYKDNLSDDKLQEWNRLTAMLSR